MAEDGKVIYKVQIDDSGVESEAEKAGQKAGDGVERGSRNGTGMFKEAMIGAARAIGEAFVQMAAKAVQGVEQIARAGIEFNAKMEQYQTAFTTLLGSAEEAEKVMAQIRKDAASTPFDVDSLTQANQMLISAGVSAGEARTDVLNLANAIAATGGGSAELSRMAANMQQIKNVGKATAMDIRQFAMAGINIYGLLADYTGMTTEEVKELDVSYEVLSGALAKASEEGGKYAGAMEAQAQTFTGRISTLKDNATQLAGALTEDLFSKLSGTALPMVMDWVATLLKAAQTGGIEGAVNAAKGIIDGLLSQFADALPGLLETGMGLLLQVLNGITEAIPQLLSGAEFVIEQLLIALTNAAPDLLIAGIQLLTALQSGIVSNVGKLLPVAVKLVLALVQGIISALPEIIHSANTLIMTLLGVIVDNLPMLLEAGMALIMMLINGLMSAIPQLTQWLPEIIYTVISTLLAHLPEIIKAGFDILMALINGLIQAVPQLFAMLPEIVGAIMDAFREVNWGALGSNIIVGLWNGIAGAFHLLVEGLTSALGGLIGAAKRVLGISSPSKVFKFIGEMTGEGFEEGIEDTEQDITRTVTTLYSSVGDTAENAVVSGYGGRGGMEQSVSYALQATGTTGGATIIVPLSIDEREIARATAWTMGEQLAWEEM